MVGVGWGLFLPPTGNLSVQVSREAAKARRDGEQWSALVVESAYQQGIKRIVNNQRAFAPSRLHALAPSRLRAFTPSRLRAFAPSRLRVNQILRQDNDSGEP